MAQHGEIRLSLTLPQPAEVFAEADIQNPMHAVLDLPMTAYRVLELFGHAGQATDVVAGLDGHLRADAALQRHLPDTAQRLPGAALAQIAQEGRVGNRPALARFDPAVRFGDGAQVI